MEKNIIFYFTGTGNSLKVAKDIAETLGNCELVSMGSTYKLNGEYKHIGFVYPVHFSSLLKAVERFIENLDINENKRAYFFGVCTGGMTIGGLTDIANIIASKGGILSYGAFVKSFANYICAYPMSEKVEEKTASQFERTKNISNDIKNRTINKIPKSNGFAAFSTRKSKQNVATEDMNYNVNDSCVGCETCYKICPVKNIKMENKKPSFLHDCEQCTACIQWCPKQAINYKDKTQDRKRYHHPNITLEDMIQKDT